MCIYCDYCVYHYKSTELVSLYTLDIGLKIIIIIIIIKFRHIGHTSRQYGQSFFPKTISAWRGHAFAEAPSLAVFRSNFL